MLWGPDCPDLSDWFSQVGSGRGAQQAALINARQTHSGPPGAGHVEAAEGLAVLGQWQHPDCGARRRNRAGGLDKSPLWLSFFKDHPGSPNYHSGRKAGHPGCLVTDVP